jgi:hypothetical protein
MAAAPPAPDLRPASSSDPGPPGDVFAGNVYAGDVVGGTGPAPPAATGAAASGDVYQGPAADVYEGPAAAVYQGPAASQAPAAAATGASAPAGGAAAPASGSTGRSILFGLGLGLVAAYIWFGVSIATDWKLGPIAAIVGAVVGWATAAGAGRRDVEVGLLAIVLALVSMASGEYLIWDHVFNEITEEETAYRELMLEIGADRRYTTSELERFYVFGEEEEYLDSFQSLSAEERGELRAWADEEYLRLTNEPADVEAAGLSLGEFLPYLVFNVWNVAFLFIGCGAAYRIASGNEED